MKPRLPYICRLEIWSLSDKGHPRRRPAIGYQAKNQRLGFSRFFNARKHGGVRRAMRAAERFVRRELRQRGMAVSV
ncbi:MAG: hypothetical protein JWM41_2857 [Gemmatimonadetes bacterium]|nr:hypothetical protein [Gemmatimonadota bacterium]